jgi:hypothetical protein
VGFINGFPDLKLQAARFERAWKEEICVSSGISDAMSGFYAVRFGLRGLGILIVPLAT